ncbi:hypothetical protein B2J93_558 [Marssonina coronariae]|uniref:Uncharacterized protein n=1 Tax=Diplocarpon coronariae TaxID=2795749 RepID=A0A218ZAZ4_9HELO|nr:hypothetical protein B2J93_558 [Marssonina coronariae]
MRPPPPHMYTMQTDDPKIFFPRKSVDMALLKKELAKHLVTSPLPCGNIGASEYQSGCPLLPRDVAEDNNNTAAEAVSRNMIEAGVLLVGAVPDGSAPVQTSNIFIAVLPAWRGALVYRYLKIGWNSSATVRGQMEKDQDSLAHDKVPQLEVVTFESGAHLNEAHYRRLDFRDIFFGELQAKRLALRIKSLLTQQQVLVLMYGQLRMMGKQLSDAEQAWEKAQAELAREAETASIPEVEIKSESTDSPENFKFKQRPSAAAPDETCTATKKHRISAAITEGRE